MNKKMMTIGLVLALAVTAQAQHEQAQQILKETGVTGGLVVHLGCGDGKLTAALRASEAFVVQGLDRDLQKVAAAKQSFIAKGLGGAVTARVLVGDRLPYAEEMVNLLVVTDDSGIARAELERVLVPGGVAMFLNPQSKIENRKLEKPWPKEIDEWTHYYHDAGNTGTSRDTRVGPPKRIKWNAPPLMTRRHFAMSFVSLVSAGGRVFTVVDAKARQSNRSLGEHYELVARDAFNGVELWRYPLPDWYWIPAWTTYGNEGGSRFSGTRPQTVVTDGKHVYLFTGKPGVLTAIDAVTGKNIKQFPEVCGLGEMVQEDGVLLVAVRPMTGGAAGGGGNSRKTELGAAELSAIKIGSWERLWHVPAPDFQYETLTLRNGRAFYESDGNMVALDAQTGRELWRSTDGIKTKVSAGYRFWNPVAVGDLLIVSRQGFGVPASKGWPVVALDAATGKLRWVRGDFGGYREGMFPVGDRLYVGTRAVRLSDGTDADTVTAEEFWSKGHHFRCYPWRMTPRYLISNNRGCEFLPLSPENPGAKNDFVRGNCSLGVFPANGLLYTPPHGCLCYNSVMQYGFLAYAPDGQIDNAGGERLERGPAYGRTQNSEVGSRDADWAMYRQNARRLGTSVCQVGPTPAVAWNIAVGGNLTPPVCVGGLLVVADKDAHRVLAFDAAGGAAKWTFAADARIDSPPTLHAGRVLFGSADGFVYCLDAQSGELAWRFRAAPAERWIGVNNQIESAWPVHGSVLVEDGVAYVTAGRNTWFDGGIHVYALDPATGKVLHQRLLKDAALPSREELDSPPYNEGFHSEGTRSDLLVSDGERLYMGPIELSRTLEILPAQYISAQPSGVKTLPLTGAPYVDQSGFAKYSEEKAMSWNLGEGKYTLGAKRTGLHLSSGGGFINSAVPFERFNWMYAKLWPGSNHAWQGAKSGQILCVDAETTYGVKVFTYRESYGAGDPSVGDKGQLLFADTNDNEPVVPDSQRSFHGGIGYTRTAPPKWFHWLKMNFSAMTVAGDHLFVTATPLDKKYADPFAPYEGRAGAVLLVFNKRTGEQLAKQDLDFCPVFDGLIAANGRLYLAATDGRVRCYTTKKTK